MSENPTLTIRKNRLMGGLARTQARNHRDGKTRELANNVKSKQVTTGTSPTVWYTLYSFNHYTGACVFLCIHMHVSHLTQTPVRSTGIDVTRIGMDIDNTESV